MAAHTEQWIQISDERAARMLQKLYASLNPTAKFTGEKVWKVEGFPGNRTLLFQQVWLNSALETIAKMNDEELSALIAESDFGSHIGNLDVRSYLLTIIRGLLPVPENK